MSFPYAEAQLEDLACNFCGKREESLLSKRGQDDLPLRSILCKNCGLVYINPRMTAAWYLKYYQDEYRSKTIEHGEKGRQFDFDGLFDEGYRHGVLLSDLVKEFLTVPGVLLEVGSSAGGVLKGLKDKLGREVLGIEPSETEARYAEGKGVKTLQYLVEEVEKYAPDLGEYGAVLCTQSLNHLLDPRFFLTWSHRHLTDGGLLILEVMNFRDQLKKAGLYHNAVKIDHPFMFTPEVLRDFVRSAGFEVLYLDADEGRVEAAGSKESRLPDTHIRLIARKTNERPFTKFYTNRPSFLSRLKLIPLFIYLRYVLKYRLKLI